MFGVMDVLFNPDKDEDAARVINNLLEKSDEDATKDIMMLPMEVTRAISVILIRDLRIIREEPQDLPTGLEPGRQSQEHLSVSNTPPDRRSPGPVIPAGENMIVTPETPLRKRKFDYKANDREHVRRG